MWPTGSALGAHGAGWGPSLLLLSPTPRPAWHCLESVARMGPKQPLHVKAIKQQHRSSS